MEERIFFRSYKNRTVYNSYVRDTESSPVESAAQNFSKSFFLKSQKSSKRFMKIRTKHLRNTREGVFFFLVESILLTLKEQLNFSRHFLVAVCVISILIYYFR